MSQEMQTSSSPKPVELDFSYHADAPESLRYYVPGGYHPVLLHQTFKDERYKVIRKLGLGSCTVWLAHDRITNIHVALKIVKADSSPDAVRELDAYGLLHSDLPGSNHVVRLLDTFRFDGPNGCHRCLVFEAMAGSTAFLVDILPDNVLKFQNFWTRPKEVARFPTWMAKQILRDILSSLAYFHGQRIVLGDLQPDHILLSLRDDWQSVSTSELEQDPRYIYQVAPKDQKSGNHQPPYLVAAQELIEHANLKPGFVAKICSLSHSFSLDNPPSRLVSPEFLRAPELIYQDHSTVDTSIDIWAFGVLIYEFLAGTMLFTEGSILHGISNPKKADDELLCRFNDTLGPLPEELFAQWPRARNYFDGPQRERQYPLDGYDTWDYWSDEDSDDDDDDDEENDDDDEDKDKEEEDDDHDHDHYHDHNNSDVVSSPHDPKDPRLDNKDKSRIFRITYRGAPSNKELVELALEKRKAEDEQTPSHNVMADSCDEHDDDVRVFSVSLTPNGTDFICENPQKLRPGESPFKSLEVLFEKNRPKDIDPEEAKEIVELVRTILKYSPSERPTAAQLLEHDWFQRPIHPS